MQTALSSWRGKLLWPAFALLLLGAPLLFAQRDRKSVV